MNAEEIELNKVLARKYNVMMDLDLAWQRPMHVRDLVGFLERQDQNAPLVFFAPNHAGAAMRDIMAPASESRSPAVVIIVHARE